MKTIALAHDELLIAIAFLEEKKTDTENARKSAKMRRELDMHEARIYQAEKKVVEAAKDFVHYLSEACIKF
tara:strand:- start:33 stop:245 length:213 start_codon:yes stop_codon:yes gene_type:complete